MYRIIICLLAVLLIASCTSQQVLYSDRPRFVNLNPEILMHPLFADAPRPQVRRLQYVSSSYPNGAIYSDYNIFLQQSQGKITEYQTTERQPHSSTATLRANGEGVGYGGIFMLLYRKRGVVANNANFYQKFAMTQITDVKGRLFPLQLGNELSFHFKGIYSENYSKDKERGKPLQGTMVYKVVEELKNYHFARVKIHGPIYKIEVWRSTHRNPTLHIQYAYYFSPKLGCIFGPSISLMIS